MENEVNVLKQVLWIEDEALDIRSKLYAGPIYASGEYFLTNCTTIEDGIRKICDAEKEKLIYDAIVIDIRFGPQGDRNGLELLKIIFSKPSTLQPIMTNLPPNWRDTIRKIDKNKIGILTVETKKEIVNDLDKWEIPIDHNFCDQKHLDENPDLLLKLLNRITKSKE